MPTEKYVSEKPAILRTEVEEVDFKRADIRFIEVDHSGASYEGRVFLNNRDANEKTAKTPEKGYAGSFYVFGHGGCYGDVGHCDVPTQRRPYDLRDPHPLLPRDMNVIITEALRKQMKKSKEVHVTVVPVVMASTEKCDLTKVLKFKRFEILTYK
jgi:tyrosinase